jgi:hypothetical protein
LLILHLTDTAKTDSATNYHSVFESNFYPPLTDATYNSTRLVLKPRYQRKLDAANAAAARKIAKKKAKARVGYAANSVTLDSPGLQPTVPESGSPAGYVSNHNYKLELGSLTGCTLVAAEDLAQSITKHVKFAGSQSFSATATLVGAPPSVIEVRKSQVMKKIGLPPHLRKKYQHGPNRNDSHPHHRQHQKRHKHSFNYHMYSAGPAFFPILRKENKSFETLESENDAGNLSMFETASVATGTSPSTEASIAQAAKAKVVTNIANNKQQTKRNQKKRRLAHFIASPVLTLSPVFKRASERVRNHDAKKGHLFGQKHHAQETPMPSSKKVFESQSTPVEPLDNIFDQTGSGADDGDKVSDESDRLSSLVALVTPYLQTCLGDVPTVPNKNVAGVTDHKSLLETLLEKQANTPTTTVNALVIEHLLLSFGKLQVHEPGHAALPEEASVRVEQQDQHPQINPWGNTNFLQGNSDDTGVGEVSSRAHSQAQLEYLAPTSFSSACSTKYVPSAALLSSNPAALKLDGDLGYNSASTSPYDDVEFLW